MISGKAGKGKGRARTGPITGGKYGAGTRDLQVEGHRPSLLIIGSRYHVKRTVRDLREEAKKIFGEVLFVPVTKIRVSLNSGKVEMRFKGRDLFSFDACYPRLSSTDFVLAEAILRLVEDSGMYSPVSVRGFLISNHKYYTIKELCDAGIPVVGSGLFISPETAKKNVSDFPVVVKKLSGFAGKGVVLVNDSTQFGSILDTMHMLDEFLSTQEFVPDRNTDIRCYVFGEKVLAVRRTGRQGEWRANISRGGKATMIEATDEMKLIALRSAKVMRMEICAVDLIETPDGLKVIEVNFMPGPFSAFLGPLVPREMVEFIHRKVAGHGTDLQAEH